MTARRGAGGGLPFPVGAPAPGGDRRNLRIAFENLSAPATPSCEAARLPLERGNLAQAVFDGIAVVFLPLFASLLASAFGVAFYIVLFVRPG